MEKFHGTGVALVTPFDQQRNVDFEGLGKLIEYQIENEVDYLVSLGTTGETATLSAAEKQSIWEYTTEKVNGRLPLIVGIGGNNTAEVVKTLENFNLKGYDAVLSVSPYYNKPNQEGIYQHYQAVANSSPLPILLYNVPARTGSNIAVETTLRLANNFENIIGIKEAAGNFDQFNKIIRDKPQGFLFISGDDAVALPLIAMGAVGVISVLANALPKQVSNMIRLCLEGKFKEAQPLHQNLLAITELIFVDGNPPGVKAVLKELGICSDFLRLPLANVSEETYLKIKEELQKFRN